MRTKISIYIFIINFFLLGISVTSGANRLKLISIIDQELKEVARLNKQTNNRRPKLLLRYAELELEKARVIKEIENEKYLKVDAQIRKKKSKRNYFLKSYSLFKRAQKTCEYILSRFKKFNGRGSVYYILAYNAKEFNQIDKAQRYFSLAIKSSQVFPEMQAKAKLALAEIYYNKNEFKKSIPLYNSALRKRKDKWMTKDLYNLAWAYFKVGRKNDAISTMKRAYSLSQNPKYINVSRRSERDIAYFYTESNRANEATRFYKAHGKRVAENLIKVARYLIEERKFTSAEKALLEAKKNKKSRQEDIKIHLLLLNIYEKFGKTISHHHISKYLNKYVQQGKMGEEDKDLFIFHLEKMSAELQRQAVSKRYINQREEKSKYVTSYFLMLMELKSKKRGHYELLIAETLYSSGSYNEAVKYYNKSYLNSKSKKDRMRSLDGLLASLGKKEIRPDISNKYLISSYNYYLKENPSSTKSYQIYQRLFTRYIKEKRNLKAEKTLNHFSKNYPRDTAKQEVMVGNFLDLHYKNNNRAEFDRWMKLISINRYNLSSSFKKKARSLKGKMKFAEIERSNSQGNKGVALAGYIEAYQGKDSDRSVKKNSAYNLAVLYYEAGNNIKHHEWAQKALSLMSKNDVFKLSESFFLMAVDHFNKQYFSESLNIYQQLLDRTCSKNLKSKKIFFKNAILISLADNQLQKAEKTLLNGKRCLISQKDINDSHLEIMAYLLENSLIQKLEGNLSRFKKINKKQVARLVSLYGKLEYHFSKKRNHRKARKYKGIVMSEYKRLNHNNIPLDGLDEVARIKTNDLNILINRFDKMKLSFPEKRFNQMLKVKLKLLDQITSSGIAILKVGSGQGIVESYKKLVLSYSSLAQELFLFTPPSKSKTYIKSFKKSMRSLGQSLDKKGKEFRSAGLKQVRKFHILSDQSKWFLGINSLYGEKNDGVLMDRKGRL